MIRVIPVLLLFALAPTNLLALDHVLLPLLETTGSKTK